MNRTTKGRVIYNGRHCRRAKIVYLPRESNPGRWIYRQTLYHVAVKASFCRQEVEVYEKKLRSEIMWHWFSEVRRTGWTYGVGSTGFYLKVVMLHITFKGMEHTEYHSSTYSVLIYTLNPQMGSKGQNVFVCFFAESSHVAYQNNGNGA